MRIKATDLYKQIRDSAFEKTGDDVDYTICVIEDHPALLFEETTTTRDWEINICFPRRLYTDTGRCMIVHGGYGHAWESARNQIMKQFMDLIECVGNTPIISGWSYGGAMAVLAAEDLYFRTGKKAQVITYGAPKVAGTLRTAKYIRKCGIFRQYAIKNDLVPALPPFPGFHHINKLSIGEPFKLSELLNPEKNHQEYGNPKQYGGNNDIGI